MNPQLATQMRHLRLSGMVEALPLRLEQSKSAELDPLGVPLIGFSGARAL